MPTGDATLLPAIGDGLDDRDSSRTLDDVGVGAVLGALIEHRRRSSHPAADEVEPIDEAPRSRRVPTSSDAFLKVR